MGDPAGKEALLAEAQRLMQSPVFPAEAPKGSVDSVAALVWALGGTGDRTVVLALTALAGKVTAHDRVRVRALAVSH